MESRYLKYLVIFTMTFMSGSLVKGESLMGGHLDNQRAHPDASNSSMRYKVVNVVPFAFNGGQPFSLEKDPVTGQIDFDKAPPLSVLNYTGSYDEEDDRQMENEEENSADEDDNISKPQGSISLEDEDQQPNEINPYSPSFHDFLNLPVRYSNHEKYTSDKYPLISSSYANTKVQGGSGHKGYIINYNNFHYSGGKASTSQSYSMTRKPFTPRSTIMRTNTTPTTTTTMRTTTTTVAPTTTTTIRTTKNTPPSTKPSTIETTTVKVTTWKPKIDRYDVDYEEEAILPIEKIQIPDRRTDLVHHESSNPLITEYDDSYDEFIVVEPASGTSSTIPSTIMTSTTTTTTTTQTPRTTTSTTTTTTTTPAPKTTSTPSSKISVSLNTDVIRNSDNIIEKNPVNQQEEINGHSNGHLNLNPHIKNNNYLIVPSNSFSLPNYSNMPVESSSNVIVPPDQDTISFVLGNRQNVQGSYYAHGSAIPESPYPDVGVMRPMGPSEPVQPENLPFGHQPHIDSMHSHSNLPPEQFGLPEEHGINWWFNPDTQEKPQNIPEIVKDDKINVVSGNRIVFPTEPSTSEYVQTLLPPSSTVSPAIDTSMTLSEVLTPPAKDGPRPLKPGQRPPLNYYPPHHHYHPGRPSEVPSRIQRLPIPPSGNGYKIRPPPIDVNLPNILPQFRPNVQTSQRRGSEVIGTKIVPSPPRYPPRGPARPPSGPLPPAHHRGPLKLPPPIDHLMRLNPPPFSPAPVHSLRLPTPAALVASEPHVQATDNAPVHKEIIPYRRNGVNPDGKLQYDIDERNRLGTVNNQLIKSRLNDEDLEKLSAETPAMPPKTPLFPKRKNGNSSVATLQMIQQHGVHREGEIENKNDSNENENKEDVNRRIDEPPVYVVYPVKGSLDIHPDTTNNDKERPLDESVVVGIHGLQRPLPPDTLSQQENAENEEISTPPPVQLASDFPYPLEKPDASLFINQGQETPLLVPDESDQQMEEGSFHEKLYLNHQQNHQEKDASVNIIPYIQDHLPYAMKPNVISATLQLFPDSSSSSGSASSPSSSVSAVTPIAYVYTPTMRVPLHRPNEQYERNPVLLPSQQPSSSSSSAPSPQSFMAPFIASMSAEMPSKNGWSVVTGGPYVSKPNADDRIDKIDEQSDSDDKKTVNESNINPVSTEKNKEHDDVESSPSAFDSENFKPQLFGGFKPIFEFPSDSEEMPSDKEIDATMIKNPRVGRQL